MKAKYQILQTVLLVCGLCALSTAANAQAVSDTPKILIGVMPTESRWITLSDGQRVNMGEEITTTLIHRLSTSEKISPVDMEPGGISAPVALTIRPVIETLVYGSGSRSNRVVFGFSPDYQNDYNSGLKGSFENEFIPSNRDQYACVKPDYFGGAFNPAGWGPFRSNFGADIDEGVIINILGYGLGFKQKKYEVKSQVRFLMDDTRTGEHTEVVFQTTAKGQDIFVAASYQGYSLAVDIQRRETLLEALRNIVPHVVDNLVAQKFSDQWQTTILQTSGEILANAGIAEGLRIGMELASPFNAVYRVKRTYAHTASLEKVSGFTQAFIGEPLRPYTGEFQVWKTQTVSSSSALLAYARPGLEYYQSSLDVPFNKANRAQSQTASIQQCMKAGDWVTDTIEAIFSLYALYRYKNVLDQDYKGGLVDSPKRPTVALIDSGYDYNDKLLSPLTYVKSGQVVGMDLIAMDRRPSDDNGHGSAAAKLLVQSVGPNINLISVKVIGSHGETSSGAILEGFKYAIQQKPDAILVPWNTGGQRMGAIIEGMTLATAQNIPVFLANPNDVGAEFQTTSLGGAPVRLEGSGRRAVERLAQWISEKFLGGHYDSAK